MKRALTANAALMLSTLLWMVRLITAGDTIATDAGAMLGATLVMLGAVAAAGMLLAASRWALRLGIGLAAFGLVLGAFLPIDVVWAIALATSAAALAMLIARWTDGVVRGLEAAAGPSWESVILSVGLVAFPGVVAIAGSSGLDPIHWVLAGSSLVTVAVYTKALPGALVLVRFVFPAVLVVAAVVDEAWYLWIPAAVGFGTLAWRAGTRLAVKPLAREGKPVPILPELVPEDVLDAAGLDEKGRRRP